MKKIEVKSYTSMVITKGPSSLGIEHSLFDEQVSNETRKHVRFEVCNIDIKPEDWILKCDEDFGANKAMTAVVIGAFRVEPYSPICHEWVLWILDGGAKMVAFYSTATRTGSIREVETFEPF